MSEANSAAWKKNLHSKCEELKRLIDECLQLLPSKNRSELNQRLSVTESKVTGTCDLFADNLVPATLKDLKQVIVHLRNRPNNASHIKNFVLLQQRLDKISQEDQDASFTQILESHRDDEDLQERLDELIESLKQLLDVGDAELSNQVATRLSKILEEIEKRRNKTLFDLDPWVEWALISLGSIIDAHMQTPIGAVIASALLAAKKSKMRVSELIAAAKTQYLESLELKGFDPEVELKKNPLLQTSIEDLEKQLRARGCLRLEDNSQN